MNEEHKSRFDLSQIGEADKHNLCATFLEAIKQFYDDPANRESFERWQQERSFYSKYGVQENR